MAINSTYERGYAKKLANAQERSRKMALAGRDIAPLPSVVNPIRKINCSKNLELFLLTYLPEKYTKPFHTEGDYWDWDIGHQESCWADGEPHGTIETRMDVYWDEYSQGGTHKEKVQKTIHHDAEKTTRTYWYCPDCGEKVYQNNKPNY